MERRKVWLVFVIAGLVLFAPAAFGGTDTCSGTLTCSGECSNPGDVCVPNPIDCACTNDTCTGQSDVIINSCGDNLCPTGMHCESIGRKSDDPNDVEFNTFLCGCVADETPCGESSPPTCGGACPTGMTCQDQTLTEDPGPRGLGAGGDPNDPNAPVPGCGCVPDEIPCAESSPPTCGGACPTGMICAQQAQGGGGGDPNDPNDPNGPGVGCSCVQDPNTPGTGDCCVTNETVGCDNLACQTCVCGLDPFCCSTSWDGICAGEAAAPPCDTACGCDSPPVPEDTPETCSDELDNDNDGLIDCLDPDCLTVLPCAAAVPALSSPAAGVLAAMLILVGVFGVTQISRRHGR